ncbi:MAG: hypothetical protein NTX14_00485 [Candidatus Nealsonbacteria bacterium]|nr:hypothetical protein [Candidatus Nealsonbacteria bacterium]
MTTKEEFLLEHNRLSPASLLASEEMLSRFRAEKAVVFKDNDWSVEKLRRPFIIWMTSLSIQEKEEIKNSASRRAGQAKTGTVIEAFNSYPKKRGVSAREGRGLQKDEAAPAERRF